MSITFFNVSAPVKPPPNFELSNSTNESIVGVLGESKASSAGTLDGSCASTLVIIASTFAAKPHFGHKTYVSSPVVHGAKNSSDLEPPMAPETAFTMLYFIPKRSKVFTYASRCFW